MILFARIVAVAFGLCVFIALLWLIWAKLAWNIGADYILSLLALFFSVVLGAVFGEHFLNFLLRNKRRQ